VVMYVGEPFSLISVGWIEMPPMSFKEKERF
jgi:hypothetical protein